MPGPNLQGAIDLSGLVRRAQAPAQSPGQGEPGGTATAGVITATDESFGEVVELSQRVPVLVEFVDPALEATGVDAVVATYSGRIVLARVDPFASPQLAQAFRVEQVPFFAAVIAGRPLPLVAGLLPEEQLRDVLEQLLQVASQQGVTGSVDVSGAEPVEQPEPPLPPRHQAALDAIEAGDYPTAIAEYEAAITENPRDDLAAAGLAQVRLLDRLGGDTADATDRAFAEGRVDEAFGALLDEFPGADQDGRDRIRARLLEFFEILGPDDPRVAPARLRLTNLLF